jgi:hypothetical protein
MFDHPTIGHKGIQLYVQEIVCGGQQMGVGCAQNVVSLSKEITTNMILSYFIFEHWELSSWILMNIRTIFPNKKMFDLHQVCY